MQTNFCHEVHYLPNKVATTVVKALIIIVGSDDNY